MTVDDDALFRQYIASGSREIRNQIVERHLGLAAHIARRVSPGAPRDDDLRQVAMLGLVKAVERFDPDHGSPFSAFAGATIEGEIKRHFRDRTWMVRVPRSAKELHLAVRRGTQELAQLTGRSPTVVELADHLGIARDDVLRGLAASAAYGVGSLDGAETEDQPDADRQRALGVDEHGFEQSDDRHVVSDLLALLPEREREIVRMRFYDGLSQQEIANAVGVSQMHVSRLLRQSFERMRQQIDRSNP